MAHEEQNDPVAQSSMYQRRPPNLVASTADLSERDIKENPVVKEEETNDTEVFEEVVVEVARLSKEPKSSISLFTIIRIFLKSEAPKALYSSHSFIVMSALIILRDLRFW